MEGQSFSEKYVLDVAEGKENPFYTFEALQENLQAIWGVLAKAGENVWDDSEGYLQRPKGEVGSLIYHLSAVDNYASRLFSGFAALEPDVYAASEGEEEAFERMQKRLHILAKRHAREWESM
jgi:hypothetical protein